MAKRPTHQKKFDSVLHGKTTAASVRCDMSLAPFDRTAREMEKNIVVEWVGT